MNIETLLDTISNHYKTINDDHNDQIDDLMKRVYKWSDKCEALEKRLWISNKIRKSGLHRVFPFELIELVYDYAVGRIKKPRVKDYLNLFGELEYK